MLALAAPALASDGATLIAYMRARAADAGGRSVAAARDYAVALAAHPHDEVIAIRAYRQALAAGDMHLADRAAAVLIAGGVAPSDADIVALTAALAASDLAGAEAANTRLAAGGLDFLAPVVAGWLALARGESDAAARLDMRQRNPVGARYAAVHRSLLLLAGKRLDGGLAAARATLTASDAAIAPRIAAAARLADKGRRDAARGLLAGDGPVLADARRRLERDRLGKGAVTAVDGIALLLAAMAQDIGDDRGSLLGIALARSALRLRPADDATRIVLARALAAERDEDAALAELARVSRGSPHAAQADVAAAAIRQAMGDHAEALAIAARRADAGTDPAAIVALGDLLLIQGRSAEAATAYARATALFEARGEAPAWMLRFQEGAARERAGEWAAARTLLERALADAPDEPALLNYLGYSQVDRGENMDVAQARIARASMLRPDDASITDSLGWAYFRRGDHQRAVVVLEKAARAEPGDAEINDHLGDAYWAVGRRFEARYAWAAARLAADDAAAARIGAKIADGPR